jgi:dTDP-4-amino-4,6-dideoxygalactose transaminase
LDLKKTNKFFHKKFKKSFNKILQKGSYILGENVTTFEKELSNYLKVKYCVGVGNCLDALILSIQCLDLPKKSEIILPANSYIASALAVTLTGNIPVLVEPNLQTYNIDYKKIEEKITKRTKVIMPVHLYGKSSDMIEIMRIAKRNNLYVIEDCAQSIGSSIKNKFTGTFGDFGCFSFYPTKNLGALGDGGAVVCDNKFFYEKLIRLRNYGSKYRYKNDLIGRNTRLDEIQAAFLLDKLSSLKKINDHKSHLAKIYHCSLDNKFIKPVIQKFYKDTYYVFNIRHKYRDKLKQYLFNKGVETDIHYPLPLYKQKCFRSMFSSKFPLSDLIHRTSLSLPISLSHKSQDITYVSNLINNFLR